MKNNLKNIVNRKGGNSEMVEVWNIRSAIKK